MKGADRPRRILYLVYWGAAEPLGQSLVLPAVQRLASLGHALTLITFEKGRDLVRADEMARIAERLREVGVEWVPLRYHKRPKWPATLWDVGSALRAAVTVHARHRIEIVHARTFVGGVMGLAIAPAIGARFVFHNEGFYPDEQVDAGVWRRGSLVHRLARKIEGLAYRRADGIIVLSKRARDSVGGQPAVRRRATPIIVVPSCVDLGLFNGPVPNATPLAHGDALRRVYVGSTGGRYRVDQVGPLAAVARKHAGKVHVRVLSSSPPLQVARLLTSGGLHEDEFSVGRVPHEQIPRELARQHVGLALYARGLSEHACSPTKVGEYWASGLPVLTSPNLSDMEEIIRQEQVGVVLRDLKPDAYEDAIVELLNLLRDPALGARCHSCAERYYSIDRACRSQDALYRAL